MAYKINTYRTEEFREKYLDNNPSVDSLFKRNYETFFCLKIEDVKNYTKFPIPPSREDCHTLILITSGSYKHKIGFNGFVVKKAEIICTSAGQIFSVDSIPNTVRGYTCHFHPNILIGRLGNNDLLNHFDFLKVWGNPHIKLGPIANKFILNLFNRLHFEYSRNGITNTEIIQAYLLALIIEVNNNYKVDRTGKHSSAISITNKFKENLFLTKAQRSVSDYAIQLNITPNHLNKCVKSVTGKSCAKWISETIVMEAKYSLYQTDLTINEIAQELGHHDHSYFTRLFKKVEGVSPFEFRKLIEKS